MRRMMLLGWAAPLGLATGLAAWLAAGGASANLRRLDAVGAQILNISIPTSRPPRLRDAGADLLTMPLFALTTGPGALREPSLRLDGISLTRQRAAVLISIDGKPAAWLRSGETVEGVTLQAVTPSNATLETQLGAKTLNLGEQSAASAPDPRAPNPQPATVQASASDQPPPGFRAPPEPASAAPRP